MATTTGSSGDDLINGTSTNDNLNGGAGDDTLLGGAGNDNLSGGSGNDTLNGDAGSDTLNGGSGSDLLIYKLAENANGTDLYTGGSGIDTVELQLTTLEWESATVQQQLNYYFGHLETVRRSGQGEVSNGQASDFTFQFGTSTLTVSMMENLQVKVDGVLLSNLDAPYIDSGDTTDHGSLVEDGIQTASGTLAFFDLDASDTHTFQIVDEPSSAFGTLALAPSDSTGDGIGQVNWTHVLNNEKAQSLGEGQVATETYTVRIADSDNTANYVDRTITINITGENDAPSILGGDFTASLTEDKGVGTGKVTTDFGGTRYGSDRANGAVIDASGRILLAGSNGTDFALARYNPDGSLDTSFGGGDGKVTTNIDVSQDFASCMAIDASGRILLAGVSGTDFGLARYNPDGSLDTSFGGGDGMVTTDIGGPRDYLSGIAIDAGGRIITGGSAIEGTENFALACYNADGSLDTSFGGGDGKVTTDFAGGTDIAYSVAVDASGRIVVGGYANSSTNFALARYNADGSLDTSFGGGDGMVTTNIGSNPESARCVRIDASGRILLAGMSGPDFALARYNPDGSLDTSFGGGDGIVTTDFGLSSDFANSIAFDASGRIVVAGRSGGDFGIVRYNTDGSLDTSFGSSGQVRTDFRGFDEARTVLVDASGRIVVTGVGNEDGSQHRYTDFVLARYNPDGSLDTSFGAPPLEANGTLAFDDVDLSDAHSVSVAGNAGNLLGGTLVADITDAATGAGTGTVAWSYSVANGATQYLGEGEEAKESFTVTLNDGHGGTVNQLVTITIAGANDTPVITGSTMNVIREHLINSTHDGFTSDNVGTVLASDPDGDPLTYSILSDSSGGGFTIDATTGQVSVRDVSLLDYEGGGLTTDADGNKYYSLQVQVSDGNLAATQSTKVYLTNVTNPTANDQIGYVDQPIGERDTYTEGNDAIFGDATGLRVSGGDGDDYLSGGPPGNIMKGGYGNDILYGGPGRDFLVGDSITVDVPYEPWVGADTFVFGDALGDEIDGGGDVYDAVADFAVGVDKILLVSDALGPFSALADSGTLAASQFDLYGSAGIDADTRIIYDPSSGALSYDADGSGSAFAAIHFANIVGAPALSETDFILGPPPGP